MTDVYLDGNVLAGPLSEALGVDLTIAVTTCAGCGRQGSMAELRVYPVGSGLVARCTGCEGVVVRYLRTPSAGYLDLRGSVSLRIPLPVEAAVVGGDQ